MTLDARARAAAQAIDDSATRLDPVAGLDVLLRRRRRQPLQRAAAAAALVLLVLVVAIWAGMVWRGPAPVQPPLGPVVTRFRAGPKPVSVALSPGVTWVVDFGNTITRIDPTTGKVQGSARVRLPANAALFLATVGDGKLWVVYAVGDKDPEVFGVDLSTIQPGSTIDPSTSPAVTTIRPRANFIEDQARPGDIVAGSGSVWVALQAQDQVARFDAATGKLLGHTSLPHPTALALDGQTLWVATADGRLHSIDTHTETVRLRAATGMLARRLRVGQGGVWLMTIEGNVLRLDPQTNRVAQVQGAFRPADLAVGPEGVWVYDQHRGVVARIDPQTMRVVRTVPVIGRTLVQLDARVLAVGNGAVWLVDKSNNTVVRVDPYR
jgi:streptogramin lyase